MYELVKFWKKLFLLQLLYELQADPASIDLHFPIDLVSSKGNPIIKIVPYDPFHLFI